MIPGSAQHPRDLPAHIYIEIHIEHSWAYTGRTKREGTCLPSCQSTPETPPPSLRRCASLRVSSRSIGCACTISECACAISDTKLMVQVGTAWARFGRLFPGGSSTHMMQSGLQAVVLLEAAWCCTQRGTHSPSGRLVGYFAWHDRRPPAL